MAEIQDEPPQSGQTDEPQREGDEPPSLAGERAAPPPEHLDERDERMRRPRKPMGPPPDEHEGLVPEGDSPPPDVPPTPPPGT